MKKLLLLPITFLLIHCHSPEPTNNETPKSEAPQIVSVPPADPSLHAYYYKDAKMYSDPEPVVKEWALNRFHELDSLNDPGSDLFTHSGGPHGSIWNPEGTIYLFLSIPDTQNIRDWAFYGNEQLLLKSDSLESAFLANTPNYVIALSQTQYEHLFRPDQDNEILESIHLRLRSDLRSYNWTMYAAYGE